MQKMLQASTFIFSAVFSSGSESPTYIIAFAGIDIRSIVQQDPKITWIIALFIFAFVLTSLSPTVILPRPAKNFIRLYSLKALPFVIIWITIAYQMLSENFESYPMTEK